MSTSQPHIVIAGGGYVGMYTALRLQKKLRRGEARVTVIDPRSTMTYQPFLPEAAAGSLEPRHVVVSLRRTLKQTEVITARVESVDAAARTIRVVPPESEPYDLAYDELVVAMGSISRTLPIPGLAEHGMGFKQIEEAIALRNHVLDRMDLAASVRDPQVRQAALTFVFVGGGYAGVEALAEAEDMARYATRFYSSIDESDLRFVLVEMADRILPEVGVDMGRYTVDRLRERGIDVKLGTKLESREGPPHRAVRRRRVRRRHPGLDRWREGQHRCSPPATCHSTTRAGSRPTPTSPSTAPTHVWTAGDNAAVPDLTHPGEFCSPSAQHAVRQAKVLGDNLVRSLRGEPLEDYRHKHVGSVASLGLHKGVAQVYGVKLRGFPAWFMHRTYHMSRMPTFNKKVRVVLDWTLALFFKRDVVSIGSLHHPRDDFDRANQ